MKVWQAGSHLSEERGGKVGDWSWKQSRRRIRMLIGLVTPYRARTAGAIVSLLAFTLVALVPPLLAKLAVDQGIKEGDLRTLAWIVLAFVVVGLLTFALSSVQTYLTGWVGERALADLRIRLFEHLQRLSLGYFERNRTGAIISRITNDVEALDTLITDGVTSLVQNVMLLVGTAVVLFVLDWRLALATLSVIPLMALATVWFRVRSNRAYRRVRERIGLVTATLAEDIAGMRVVQSYAREPRNQSSFRGINSRYRDANYETIVLNGLYFPAVDFLASLATAIVLGYGGYLLVNDQISIGTLLAFFLYLANFFDPVQQLSQLYNTFLSATAALDKIIEVLDEEPEIVDTPAALALPRIDGHVRFENVRFGYGELAEVLHGITLDVPAGTSVALVGQTGAGKSTIAKLIARFYDVREGRITIDGHDVREVEQKSLRRQLGVVPQEGFLFAGTVAENIAFARPDATEGGDRAGSDSGGRRRLDPRARGRVRDAARRAWVQALARAAPADRVRASASRRSENPDPRRGDLVGRYRHRAGDRAGAAEAPRRANGLRDRAPAVDDPERRPHRRPRPRADRRAGHARGADAARRRLPGPVRRLGRARRLTCFFAGPPRAYLETLSASYAERSIEESDDPPLVGGGSRSDPSGVLRLRDLPELCSGPGPRSVRAVELLAATTLAGEDEKNGPGGNSAHETLQPLGRAVAAEDCDCDGLDGLERKHEGCCCAACRRLPHRSLARAVRHDGPEARARRRRFEEDLAPHREAEPADPPSLDVGARREERDRSVDIPGGAPAERVRIPFARAVPPHVDREDAVPVPDEHARMRGRASPVGDENDGCAVARWNVRSVKCEAVLRRERDRSCRRPEPRRRRLSSRPVGRDDRCRDGNDEPGDEKHRYQAEPGAAGEPPAVMVAASPEDVKTRRPGAPAPPRRAGGPSRPPRARDRRRHRPRRLLLRRATTRPGRAPSRRPRPGGHGAPRPTRARESRGGSPSERRGRATPFRPPVSRR